MSGVGGAVGWLGYRDVRRDEPPVVEGAEPETPETPPPPPAQG